MDCQIIRRRKYVRRQSIYRQRSERECSVFYTLAVFLAVFGGIWRYSWRYFRKIAPGVADTFLYSHATKYLKMAQRRLWINPEIASLEQSTHKKLTIFHQVHVFFVNLRLEYD
jgi:hypothetical protein